MSMSIHIALQPVVSWLLATMVTVAPPSRLTHGRTVPEAVETVEEATQRYEEFAGIIAKVAYDPAERPAFGGADARAKTASVMLAVALSESGLRKDVYLGVGKKARGDNGRSCTAWQFNIGKGKNVRGHTCEELLADQEQAARDALHVIRSSMGSCPTLPMSDRLSMYIAGSCVANHPGAQLRFSNAVRWLDKHPRRWNDDAVVRALRTSS